MNSQRQNDLETEIDRLLRELPELNAPASLAPRVLAALARKTALPWYRQPWTAWPFYLRLAVFVLLLTSFLALCVASYQLTRAAGFSNAVQELSQTFSWVGSVWN
ncbi:MAG TPA: hypothetical protein VG672_21025, partial [Bryobacteraceae bacterium]|nr:hypothetical protein [Bryobacteraceae bacterium]